MYISNGQKVAGCPRAKEKKKLGKRKSTATAGKFFSLQAAHHQQELFFGIPGL